jgi:biotin transport system substrate-specific component
MLASASMADLLRPCEKSRAVLYDVALIIAASFLIGLSAQLAVGYPVPITGQTFAVLMLAAVLGPRRGTLAVIAYIAEGAAGLPVFAQARFGLGALKGLTAGYLFGFIPAAFLVGHLAQRCWDRRIATTILAMVLGNLVIYACGLLWLSLLIGPASALARGLYPFIAGDVVKIALAAALLPAAWRLLGRLNPADRK